MGGRWLRGPKITGLRPYTYTINRNGTSYTWLPLRVWQEFDFRLDVCHITNESHIDPFTYKVNKLDVFCYNIRLKPNRHNSPIIKLQWIIVVFNPFWNNRYLRLVSRKTYQNYLSKGWACSIPKLNRMCQVKLNERFIY